MDLKFNVPEISCDHCKNTIEELLNSQENIDSAVVDVQKKEVFVSSSNQVSIDELKTLLDDHGYTVVEWRKSSNTLYWGNDLCCLCGKNREGT